MTYYFHKKALFGIHSVTEFEVLYAGVHCSDGLTGNFCFIEFVKSKHF